MTDRPPRRAQHADQGPSADRGAAAEEQVVL